MICGGGYQAVNDVYKVIKMRESLYAEKLVWFKQNERPEAVLLVTDNTERLKIIVAWTNLEVQQADKLTKLTGKSANEVWEWLWENTRYSRAELKEKIGIPLSELSLENKMKPLIGNRVLYPDGTLNSFVQRYLREQVLKIFEAKPRKAFKKA